MVTYCFLLFKEVSRYLQSLYLSCFTVKHLNLKQNNSFARENKISVE
nr:MAG TPA: hypothetical protein [Caudoviricetes sp.]